MPRSQPSAPVGAFVGLLFALAAIAAAGALTAHFAPQWSLWWSARHWSATQCVLLTTLVDAEGLTYAYEVQDARHVSRAIAIDDAEITSRLRDHAVSGTKLDCWVDPNDATRALLDREYEGWWWLPALWSFAAFMLLTASRGLRDIGRWLRQHPDPPSTRAQWLQSFYRDGAWKMTALGSVFLAFGLAATGAFTLLPLWHWWRAQEWSESTCVMVEGRVRYTRGGQFTSRGGYVMDIAFAYQAGGRQYVSHTYSPWRVGAVEWLTNPPRRVAEGRIAETVSALALGTTHRCYVDPYSPQHAYIERRWWNGWYGIGPIGPAFSVFGLLVVMSRPRRRPPSGD